MSDETRGRRKTAGRLSGEESVVTSKVKEGVRDSGNTPTPQAGEEQASSRDGQRAAHGPPTQDAG